MDIKSSQVLVDEANKQIKTLKAEEVKKLLEKEEITLIDIEISENCGRKALQKELFIFLEVCSNFG